MPLSRSTLTSTVAALILLGGLAAAPAAAQPAPLTLPPPSLMSPGEGQAATGAGKQRAAKAPAKRRAREQARDREQAREADGQAPARRARKADPEFSESTAVRDARPRRFVPEEFDNGDGESSSSPRPFMSPSGRAGVGMRF